MSKDNLAGWRIDDVSLERFEGSLTRLSFTRGQRTALFAFSSWALGRGQLPLWQELSRRLPRDAAIVGVAAEVEGERWVRGYLRMAGVTFPVLLDRKNQIGAMLGYKAGPNVVLVDEQGRLVMRRLYDASLRKADCRAAIEGFLLQGKLPDATQPDPAFAPRPGSQGAFGEAVDLYLAGELAGCRIPWRRSTQLDPEHWISQEQLWVLDAPERFHPWIDVAWQNERLAEEGRPVCACDLTP